MKCIFPQGTENHNLSVLWRCVPDILLVASLPCRFSSDGPAKHAERCCRAAGGDAVTGTGPYSGITIYHHEASVLWYCARSNRYRQSCYDIIHFEAPGGALPDQEA